LVFVYGAAILLLALDDLDIYCVFLSFARSWCAEGEADDFVYVVALRRQGVQFVKIYLVYPAWMFEYV
jgi:hypothetical protein